MCSKCSCACTFVRHSQPYSQPRITTVPLRKTLAYNGILLITYGCSTHTRTGVFVMQRVWHVRTTYDQETPMGHANVSKFGYKGCANCLCIFPKTIYLHMVLLDDSFSSLHPLLLPSNGWSGRSSFPSGRKTEFSASHNLSRPSSTAMGTLLSSQPRQENDNTGTITNSG